MTPHVTSMARAGCARLPQRLRDPGQLREVAVFLAIGGTGALLYTALNVAFTTWGGLRPSLAILLTLALLIPPTYLAQRRFTFRSDRNHAAAFPRYLGTQLIGNGLGLIAAEAFPAAIRSHPLLAFALLALVVATTNYACLKFWAFRRAR